MSDAELQQKQEKSREYVQQPERFALEGLHLRMHSEHGIRNIRYEDGQWKCTCPFYEKRGICSHIMAAQALLEKIPLSTTAQNPE